VANYHKDGKLNSFTFAFLFNSSNTSLRRLETLYMHKSTITIDVMMDEGRVPDTIAWNATDTSIENAQKAKAMMLAFWDSADKTALRIDLWTKDMMVDEMADFFYQTFITMADTYHRATKNDEMADDIKKFAESFYQKFRDQQLKENKA
jgi:gliding motility-associated protein GldC